MKEKTIRIPTNEIIPAGRRLGIEPNLLSRLSGFPDRQGTSRVEKEWEELLPVLLSPTKVSMLMKGERDQGVLLTTLAAGNGRLLLYSGETDGYTHIRAVDPSTLQKELMESIGANMLERDLALPMSLDALFFLAALSDIIKRQKAENMLGLKKVMTPPTAEEIQKLLDNVENNMEPRWWLTAFLYGIYEPGRKMDISKALRQLQEIELVEENQGMVYPTKPGFTLMEELALRRGIVGFHSYYFDEEKPVQSTQVFLGTVDSIWILECGENCMIASLSEEDTERAIELALAPGQAIPAGYGVDASAPAPVNGHSVPADCGTASSASEPGHAAPVGYEVDASTPTPGQAVPTEHRNQLAAPEGKTDELAGTDNAATWVCSCGKTNNGNFCVSCGSAKNEVPQPIKKRFCRNCGNTLKQDAQFCVNCGQKI